MPPTGMPPPGISSPRANSDWHGRSVGSTTGSRSPSASARRGGRSASMNGTSTGTSFLRSWRTTRSRPAPCTRSARHSGSAPLRGNGAVFRFTPRQLKWTSCGGARSRRPGFCFLGTRGGTRGRTRCRLTRGPSRLGPDRLRPPAATASRRRHGAKRGDRRGGIVGASGPDPIQPDGLRALGATAEAGGLESQEQPRGSVACR
jgi:hypothetical protein